MIDLEQINERQGEYGQQAIIINNCKVIQLQGPYIAMIYDSPSSPSYRSVTRM
jgi:hypothetical protein